jgi:hypothetical protein
MEISDRQREGLVFHVVEFVVLALELSAQGFGEALSRVSC